MTRRIDAHHHLWRPARGDYGWLTPDLAPIYRDFTMADLDPLLNQCGIDATILVQAAPTEAETMFMLAEAEAAPRIAGVIGWIDFDAPDATARVEAMAANPLIVGLRPMLHDIPDHDWLLQPHLTGPLREMARHCLVLDALARPRHLSRVTALALRHPGLTIVLDHIGKPEIEARRTAPWKADVLALSGLPNVFCKLSGMATEAADVWTIDDLRPYADHILSCFGASRVMWGSDWPVVDLAGGYLRWRDASLALIADLSAADQDLILGGVAERVYLGPRGKPSC